MCVADIDPEAAVDTAESIVADGGVAVAVAADVRLVEDVDRLVGTAVSELGGLDIVVNNVGHFVHQAAPFQDTAPAQWDELYRMNLAHVFLVTRTALPHLIDRGPGPSIINLSSVEGFRGIPGHPVYAAFKAGVTQFSKSLALQVSEHGIRVNDIAPNVTRSRQLPYERWLSPDDVARIPQWVPLGRLGEASDPAGVAVFLASDLSAFVTGTTIHCDGGTYAAGGWYRTEHGHRGWTNRPRNP